MVRREDFDSIIRQTMMRTYWINNNILYSSQREIKAVVRSPNEEHISVIEDCRKPVLGVWYRPSVTMRYGRYRYRPWILLTKALERIVTVKCAKQTQPNPLTPLLPLHHTQLNRRYRYRPWWRGLDDVDIDHEDCLQKLWKELWQPSVDNKHILFRSLPYRFYTTPNLKPVLNWANVCSPNILRTLRRTMIRFLIELLVRRIWFGQSKFYFILNWLVMRCKLRPEFAADAQQTAWSKM